MKFVFGSASVAQVSGLLLLTLGTQGCRATGQGSKTKDQADNALAEVSQQNPGAVPPNFSMANAIELGQLSQIVYQYGNGAMFDYTSTAAYQADMPRLESQAAALGYKTDVESLQGINKPGQTGKVFAAIFENDQHYVVSYRGTVLNNFNNYFADANFIATQWPYGGQVHEGFRDVEALLWTDISAFFADPAHQNKPVWVTGHSMGAAVALIGASHLFHAFSTLNIEKVYVYAPPRAGNKDFAVQYATDGLEENTIKFSHKIDPINTLPLALMGFSDPKYIMQLGDDNAMSLDLHGQSLSGAVGFDKMILTNFLKGLLTLPAMAQSTASVSSLLLKVTEMEVTGGNVATTLQSGLSNIDMFNYADGAHDISSYLRILKAQ